MRRPGVFEFAVSATVAGLVAGCATAPPEPVPVRVPAAPPAERERGPDPAAVDRDLESLWNRPRDEGAGLAATRVARGWGTVIPNPADFIGATMHVPYDADRVYTVYVAAGCPKGTDYPSCAGRNDGSIMPQTTPVVLRRGDTLVSVHKPNTLWNVDTTSTVRDDGRGAAGMARFREDALLITPTMPGQEAQLTVTGAGGYYLLRAKSYAFDRHVKVVFHEPGALPPAGPGARP